MITQHRAPRDGVRGVCESRFLVLFVFGLQLLLLSVYHLRHQEINIFWLWASPPKRLKLNMFAYLH